MKRNPVKYFSYYSSFDEFETKDTKIEIVDNDTFSAASEGNSCLNFASHKRPGGGYESVRDLKMIIKTQEEDLFRRSNLPEIMNTHKIRRYYPLRSHEGLYCTSTVSKDKMLNPIDHFDVGIISVPAMVNPRPEDSAIVKAKVKLIFNIASQCNDADSKTLILGAWGCGVFNNDPRTIAELFVNHAKRSVFDKVIFAIPGESSRNYQIFKEVIKTS